MPNYVALFLKGTREIYGVCEPRDLAESDRVMDFAKAHGFEFTTGDIHSVDNLMRHVRTTYSLPEEP